MTIIREVVEAAVAIKEDEAVVATKEAVEETEETEGAVATKVGAEATTNPTTRVTRTNVRMGDIIMTTIKVGVTTTITRKEMGATVRTGPAKNNAMEIERIPITTLGWDDRRLHHPGGMFKLREVAGATETTSPRAPTNQAIT